MVEGKKVESGSFISGINPLNHDISLFLVQLLVIVSLSRALAIILRRLNQPPVIAEVIGGILLGPTALSRWAGFKDNVFPVESLPRLKLVADFGLMFYLFIVGMELDPYTLATSFKRSAPISLAGIILPFSLGVGVSKSLYSTFMPADTTVPFTTFFTFCGVAMSITAFPVLARILTERKLLSTKVGQLSLAAAGADDVIAWCLLILVVAMINNPSKQIEAAYVFFIVILLFMFLWFLIRPIFVYLVDNSEDDNGADQFNIFFVFAVMICAGFFTQAAGVDVIFGAFLVGLCVPHNRGFAIAMIEKIEDFVCILLLPLYFGYSGLNVNLATLDSGLAWGYVLIVLLVACGGKIIGCSSAAYLSGVNFRESMVIGFLMNTKGLVELIVLNLGLNAGVISQQIYGIFVVMAVVTTLLTVPLVTYFYPSQYHSVLKDDTISKRLSGDLTRDAVKLMVGLPSIKVLPGVSNLLRMALCSKTQKFDIYGLRMRPLDTRRSAVLSATHGDNVHSTIKSDAVMNSFRGFGEQVNEAFKCVSCIANPEQYALELRNNAALVNADLVLLPIDADNFPGGWGKNVSSEVFDLVKSPVAVFIDRGFGKIRGKTLHPRMIHAHGSQELFFPYFGTMDDLDILSLVESISHFQNACITICLINRPAEGSVDARVFAYLSELPNVTLQESFDENVTAATLISSASLLSSSDLILLSHESYVNAKEMSSFSSYLDNSCNASFLVLKGKNDQNDSNHTIAMLV